MARADAVLATVVAACLVLAIGGASAQQPQRAPDPLLQEAQQTLALLGLDSGRASGQPNERTTQAIRTFQQQNGLGVTGRLDDATVARLRQVRASRFEQRLGAPGTGTLSGSGAPAAQSSGPPPRVAAAPVARVDSQGAAAGVGGPSTTYGSGGVDWGQAGRTPPPAAGSAPNTAVSTGAAIPPPITRGAGQTSAPVTTAAVVPPAPLVQRPPAGSAGPVPTAPSGAGPAAPRGDVATQAIAGAAAGAAASALVAGAASAPEPEATILGLTGWGWLVPLALLAGFLGIFLVGYRRAATRPAAAFAATAHHRAEPDLFAPPAPTPPRRSGERVEPSF